MLIELSDVIRLVKDLKLFYGKQFSDQWAGTSDTELAKTFHRVLSDVTVEQFDYACKRMETSAHIPNMPTFKSWCLEYKPVGGWLTVNEAWVQCLRYSNNETENVTEQAMRAFNLVTHVLHNEGQKAAHFAFKDIYNRIVTVCESRGEIQKMYVPPKRLSKPKTVEKTQGEIVADQKKIQMEISKCYSLLKAKRSDRG